MPLFSAPATDTASSSPLLQLSREELRQLCCQLQRAHHQLRQAHELMVARVRETGRPGRARSRVENELLASQVGPAPGAQRAALESDSHAGSGGSAAPAPPGWLTRVTRP